jgi:outer membrane protein OmpA-like peptidoglycan-associated protein
MAFVMFGGCRKKEAPATSAAVTSTATGSAQAAAATTTSASAPAANAEDLVGLAQGAFVVVEPESEGPNHRPQYMLDEDPRTTWVSATDKTTNQVCVIQLAERSTIDRVQFDEAEIALDTHSPKDVLVELSDTSPADGFKTIAKVTLPKENKDGEVFAADGSVQGRWLRLTVLTNYGAAYIDFPEFRAYGKRLTTTPLPDVTGTYKTESGNFHLQQHGSSVSGCYDNAAAPLAGGIEGHVMKWNYKTDVDSGPALFVFAPDAKRIFGGFWKTNGVEEHPPLFIIEGTRISDQPGTCPHAKTPEEEMASALQDEKRLRLYGINFDSDSDHLRDESKPTLDLVADILKQHTDWKLTIEGHTDATSTPEHNAQLSTRRAEAVKAYLVTAGTDASRLTPAGLGATKPIATNDNALGRAANRRVELVRG